MSVITREYLESGAYLASFIDTPHIKWWTREQIAASLHATLAQRPNPDAPVWLFGYGSLIWNPAFFFAEQQRATLQGWRRSFCMRLIAGRGRPEHPGRMLALDACHASNGPAPHNHPWAEHWPHQTTGIAFRLDEQQLEHELMLVWMREMIGGTYTPRWQDVLLADGRIVQAILFTINRHAPFYETDTRIHTVAPIIATASGHLGHNIDYLLDLDRALHQHHIHDPYIQDLIDAVRAYAVHI
ncbi:MAG: gamma-glutamylcyclotransferase [Lautropia sp.]|nr:gamma-glutamylcyclotransferase [Lautropia sp.]